MSCLGSKGQSGVFQRITGNMPPHSVYVESFLGSGEIFWQKLPAAASVVIDADAGCIAEFIARCRNSRPASPEMTFADPRAICGDALTILPTLELPSDAVVYCDPPYVHSTRTSLRWHRYRHEMTDDQHSRLLTLLQAMNCRVMISGYPSELYRSHLQGWRCESYQTRTRGKTVTECLWCNFPKPEVLHDWRYAGSNYRERLDLKRLSTRWLARLDAMSPIKRGYLLNTIQQRFRQDVPSRSAK